MQGFVESLVSGIVLRGLGPVLGLVLMVAPPRKVARAQLKKIYVLNDEGDMTGEYVLDAECPIDYNDFLKVLPDDGIGDREALFVGEYVFTAFQSGKSVFVLLSRGHLSPEDMEWTATLLMAADAHLAAEAKGLAPPRPSEPPKATAELEKAIAERENRIGGREKELAKLEVQLQADEANLRGRGEELTRQKEHLTALADYASQMQQSMADGLSRAMKTLEVSEQLAASSSEDHTRASSKALAEARQAFEDERKALVLAKEETEAKYREALEHAKDLEQRARDGAEALERERKDTAAREAEAERMRAAIEARVQELSQRFAQMAKERLVNSHKPAEGVTSPAETTEVETAKAELAKERKFLQRRAIEMLDREEKVRAREMGFGEREAALTKREQEIVAREAALERMKVATPPASAPAIDADEARKDIERRVKIIQQKALELLDREEKLRKRAAELQALEARLSGGVPAQ